MSPLLQLLLGFTLALIIALAAYRLGSLSRSGALAAWLVGTVIFGMGGLSWAILLLTFFISSSVLTRSFAKRKASLTEKFDKGGKRDMGQVFANGGIAAVFAGLHFFFLPHAWPWLAFAGALAAANADTWATELGVLNPTQPRLLTTWAKVEKGTSGAISVYGTLSALGGAFVIALLGAALGPHGRFWANLEVITVAGMLGSLFDSLLGATIQAIYRCPACDKETEKHPLHSCGTATVQVRGWSWLNNDLVNLGCASVGALIGMLLF